MKKYIEPSVKVYEVQINHMICESLAKSETEVDGSSALSKGNSTNIWSFFDDDEEEK